MIRRAAFALALAFLAAPDERLARHRNLGKAYFESPTTHPKAVDEFRKALALNPQSVRERINLGIALIANGQTAEGIAELDRAQKQDRTIPHTWFNLGVQYKKAGDYTKAQEQFQGFIKLVPSEPMGHYNLGTLEKLAGRTEIAIREFETAAQLDSNLAAPCFQLYNLYRQAGRKEDAATQLKRFQKNKELQANAAVPEDVDWSFFAEIYDPPESAPPSPLKPIPPKLSVKSLHEKAPGLVVLDVAGAGKPEALPYLADAADLDNDGLADLCVAGPGKPYLLMNVKGKLTRKALPDIGEGFARCVALDYDHDYDLDLLFFGARNVLLRNQGEAGFADHTADFPFASGQPLSAVTFRLIPDTRGTDLLVTYRDRTAVLYRDYLAGKFQPQDVPELPAGTPVLQVADIDSNGWLDLVTGTFALINQSAKFQRLDIPGIYADFDNRGSLAPYQLEATEAVLADFNADGQTDLALLSPTGAIQLHTNQTPTQHRNTRIGLTGTKNLKLAAGSEVEIKAGIRYQKTVYRGYPLTIGVGTEQTIDTVRITWPNGLIQNEPNQLTGKLLAYKEAQRLSGSCPQVWTWNGREFVYVTDVLGVAPLGASDGEGTFFPTDSLEHILLPEMRPRDGAYEVRLTEELAEVAYLDRIRLLAVDHPQNSAIALNEKFQSPPYPPLEISVIGRKFYPASVNDLTFSDVPANPVMVLSGWTDWADGSQFRHFAQIPGKALSMPVLEYEDDSGNWKTAVADLGLPAGKPKTFAVRVPPAKRYRIRTNVDVHWTEIYLAESLPPIQPRSKALPTQTSLAFRGFSRLLQSKPDLFAWANPQPESMWNPTPGLYTRYGSVDPLLEHRDDQMVIMGSGDELTLRFSSAAFPPPANGMRRSFVLAVDGWAKDQDANTAFSQTVAPLPFHSMPSYPYGSNLRHPGGELHHRFNTRQSRPIIKNLSRISD